MNWRQTTNKYNAVAYKLGSRNYEDGLDCLTAMFRFLEDLGHDISKWNNDDYYFEYKGKKINRNNYVDELKTEEEMRDALLEFIKTEFIKTDKLKKGYICITKVLDSFGIAIYLGMNTFLIITKYGSTVIKQPNKNILEIYKLWHKQ